MRHASCGYSSGRSGLGATAANSPCRDGWMRDESMVLRGPARVWVTCAREARLTPCGVQRCAAVCSGGNPHAHLLGECRADERHLEKKTLHVRRRGANQRSKCASLKLTYLLLFETIQTRRRRRKKDFFFFFFTREGEGDIKHGRGEHRREGSKPTGTLRVLRISLTVDFVTLTHTKRGQNVFPPATSPTVTLAAS